MSRTKESTVRAMNGLGLGLVITPAFFPSKLELTALNPTFQRSIIYKLADIDNLLLSQSYGDGESVRKLLITVNNECAEVGGDWSGWNTTMREIAERYTSDQLLGVCVGNEFDSYWANNEQDVPPSFAAELCRTAVRWLRTKGIKVVATSVAGPRWIDYLAQLAELVGDDADWFDFHGYGQRPNGWSPASWGFGDLESSLKLAHGICGKPVIMSEYGVKITDAGSPERVAEFMRLASETLSLASLRSFVLYVAWFAWRDQIGTPAEQGSHAFGLLDAGGVRRPAWEAFARINAGISGPDLDTDTKLSAWYGKVGAGLLKMMLEDGTEPAQRRSSWLPLNAAPADIEECYGINGTRYYWFLAQNKGFRAKPFEEDEP